MLSWWQDLFTKRGRYGAQKSSATDERIYISKQNYTGVPADQQKEALRKFHEENPNMFMPNEEPNHTIIPQVSTHKNLTSNSLTGFVLLESGQFFTSVYSI